MVGCVVRLQCCAISSLTKCCSKFGGLPNSEVLLRVCDANLVDRFAGASGCRALGNGCPGLPRCRCAAQSSMLGTHVSREFQFAVLWGGSPGCDSANRTRAARAHHAGAAPCILAAPVRPSERVVGSPRVRRLPYQDSLPWLQRYPGKILLIPHDLLHACAWQAPWARCNLGVRVLPGPRRRRVALGRPCLASFSSGPPSSALRWLSKLLSKQSMVLRSRYLAIAMKCACWSLHSG